MGAPNWARCRSFCLGLACLTSLLHRHFLSYHINSAIDKEILILAFYNRRRKRQAFRWVHPINQRRKAQCLFYSLVGELLQDEDKSYRYLRTRERFAQLPLRAKQDLIKACISRYIIKPRDTPDDKIPQEQHADVDKVTT